MSSSARTARVISGKPAGSYESATLVLGADALAASGLGDDLIAESFSSAPEIAERVRRLGFEQGYQAALDEGVRDAAAQRDAAVADAAQRIAEVAAAAVLERQSVVDEVVGDSVDLVLDLLATLVGHEVAEGALIGRDALVRALAIAPVGEDLVVRLPPDSGLTDEEVRTLAGGTTVSVHVDPSIASGGCVVEAGPCRIDAQISTAIDRVREHLSELRVSSPEPSAR
jgi:flagellar assembly protein FliH